MHRKIKKLLTLFLCGCIFGYGCLSQVSSADYVTITDGLPSFSPTLDARDASETPIRSLDFEIVKDRPPGSGSSDGDSGSGRTGSSYTNGINKQTNTARIKEQNSDPFKKAINNAELHPHFRYPMYNIKSDNGYGGRPMRLKSSYEVPTTKEAIETIDKFASEHFTDDMTNYDKIEYVWEWVYQNIHYCYNPDYTTYCASNPYSVATLKYKMGQCLQYNGTLCEMMAYMGYDVYLMEMYTGGGQHFRMEVCIDGEVWGIEVGNAECDHYSTSYQWRWLGVKEKANIPDHSILPDKLTDWRKFTENKYEELYDRSDMPART